MQVLFLVPARGWWS